MLRVQGELCAACSFSIGLSETVSSGEENSRRNFRNSRGLAYETLVQYVWMDRLAKRHGSVRGDERESNGGEEFFVVKRFGKER